MIGFVVGMLFIGIVMFFLISFLTKDERMTIEGIPDGLEPVKYDYPIKGESFLNGHGEIILHVYDTPSPRKRLIIRKIEKPKRYRPFANAAEFEPHRDRWIRRIYNGDLSSAGCFKFYAYDDIGVYDMGEHFTYQEMFNDGRQFDDGTPFGIEVTE